MGQCWLGPEGQHRRGWRLGFPRRDSNCHPLQASSLLGSETLGTGLAIWKGQLMIHINGFVAQIQVAYMR